MTWYQRRFGPTEGIIVLNAPSIVESGSTCTAKRQYFHSKFGIPADRKVFIFVGILSGSRAIPLLIEAFQRGSIRSHLVFLGFRDTVGVAESIRSTSNIHLHPPVPHSDVVALTREADYGICLLYGVSLSDRYCLPNKLFEYAFARIPVLASKWPELERVVNQFRLGICCQTDLDGIESAVLTIERDGLAPSTADLSELAWETQAHRLRDAYRKLLAIPMQAQ
jgi:glycosyltransferase involved in cell wall biosynthesis